MIELRNYQQDLIDQVRKSFQLGYKKPLVVLPCGAGKTVCFADMADKHNKKTKNSFVYFLVHRRELIDQTIETFKKFNISQDRAYIGMVQSRSKLRFLPDPTLIIFDEAHHATAKTWTNIINDYPGVPVVGLTATPTRLNGDPLGEIFDGLVVGVGAEWLINHQYLAPYEYYAPQLDSIDPDSFQTRGSDYDQNQVTDIYLKKKIYGDVAKYIKPDRKTIIYSPSVEFSKYLADNIPGVVHFDGSTPTRVRDKIIRQFRSGEIHALSNVDLIGEGFDVPDCDTIILLRPTQSTALYIQQSTRALRYLPGKTAEIYDLVGNVFIHGMPTDEREWGLDKKIRSYKRSDVKDVIIRTCHHCERAYPGTKPICPYCGYDNGKTRQQIQQEKQAELERIERIEKQKKRFEQSKATTYQQLVDLARKRGYKNPSYWARHILKARGKNI